MPAPRSTIDHVVVVVPTYDERENVQVIVQRLLALRIPGLQVLVVDDNSPDGTGEVADGLAARSSGAVSVLHRRVKDGLGRAYVAGMQRALADGADVVVQMDADLSHPVDEIPWLLAALERPGIDVVVGSRYVRGGTTTGWPWHRRLLSAAANAYVERILGLGVRDVTSGFRAWRADTLRALDLDAVTSAGYAFQVEMTQRARRTGQRIVEVPIDFVERTSGRSKMTLAVQYEAALMPWRLRRQAHAPDRAARHEQLEPTLTARS